MAIKWLCFDIFSPSASYHPISKYDITKVKVSQLQFLISLIKLWEVGSKFLWPTFWDPWRRWYVPHAYRNISFVMQYLYLIWATLIWRKRRKICLWGENKAREKIKSKLMNKVLITFRGENKKRVFVKWVQILKWHRKLETHKGHKSWREPKSFQWGLSTHSSGTSLYNSNTLPCNGQK